MDSLWFYSPPPFTSFTLFINNLCQYFFWYIKKRLRKLLYYCKLFMKNLTCSFFLNLLRFFLIMHFARNLINRIRGAAKKSFSLMVVPYQKYNFFCGFLYAQICPWYKLNIILNNLWFGLFLCKQMIGFCHLANMVFTAVLK